MNLNLWIFNAISSKYNANSMQNQCKFNVKSMQICWYRIRYPAKHVSLRYLDLEYYYNVYLQYDFIATKYQASIQFTSKLIAKIINISENPKTQLPFSRCIFVVFYEK